MDVGTLSPGAGQAVDVSVRNARGEPLHGIECHVIETVEGCDTIVGVGIAKQGSLRIADLRVGSYRLRTMGKDTPRTDKIGRAHV